MSFEGQPNFPHGKQIDTSDRSIKTSAQIKATLPKTFNIPESPCADRDACHRSKSGKLTR